MDEQKINEFLQIVIDQIRSDKCNLDIVIDIALDFLNQYSIPAEILLDLVPHFGPDNFNEARYVLSKVAVSLSTGETQAKAHFNAGLASTFLGRIEEAEEQYKAALATDPNHVITHSNYGNLLQQSGRIEEAEEQYKAALATDPNDVITHSNYGILLEQSGRIEEAEEQYKAALATDPNDVSTHYNYGNLLRQSGRIDEAEEQYKAALATDPNHVNTHSNYGILLEQSGRIEEAEEQYKAALATDPEYANAHGAYALLLFKRNENKKALKEIKIASQLFGKEDDKVMEHLALAWFFEKYTDKFYEKGCLKSVEKKKSKGNFNKSGKYAGLAAENYMKAAEYAGEKARELYLTQGYTLMGRSEVRGLELSFLKSIQFRTKHLGNYDIAKFDRIMDGVQNASNYYRKAAEHSPERNPQCDACSKCMTILGSILDIMLAIIHRKGVSDTVVKLVEEKINYWNEQLSIAEMVYKVNKKSEKGEYFVLSLRKLIDCVDNLEKFQNSPMHEYKKALKDCMTELIEVAENIEGPLHEIIVDSTKRMEKCALKQGLYTGGIYDKSTKDQSVFKAKLKWIIDHPIKSGIGFILAVFASYIANNLDKI